MGYSDKTVAVTKRSATGEKAKCVKKVTKAKKAASKAEKKPAKAKKVEKKSAPKTASSSLVPTSADAKAKTPTKANKSNKGSPTIKPKAPKPKTAKAAASSPKARKNKFNNRPKRPPSSSIVPTQTEIQAPTRTKHEHKWKRPVISNSSNRLKRPPSDTLYDESSLPISSLAKTFEMQPPYIPNELKSNKKSKKKKRKTDDNIISDIPRLDITEY
uniref:Triadin-like n=1 Tax=Diabrotica virgifera virgifera TaxID=50390 RepID=A0A6P7GCC3_DIAVI